MTSDFSPGYILHEQINRRLEELAAIFDSELQADSGIQSQLDQIYGSIDKLTRIFHLSETEAQILSIIAAHEFDPTFRARFSVLIQQGELGPIRYTDLVSYFQKELSGLNAAVCSSSPLFFWGLLNSGPGPISIADGPYLIDSRMRGYLTGANSIDARLSASLSSLEKCYSLTGLHFDPAHRKKVIALGEVWKLRDARKFAVFSGPSGCGQLESAAWLAGELQISAYSLNLENLRFNNSGEQEHRLLLALREAALAGALLVIRDPAVESSLGSAAAEVIRHASWLDIPIVLCVESHTIPVKWARHAPQHVRFDSPGVNARKALWEDALVGYTVSNDISAQELAQRYRLTMQQIYEAVKIAAAQSVFNRANAASVSQLELTEIVLACRALSQSGLSSLAKKMETNFSWGDLVLQSDVVVHLKQLADHVRHRDRVFENWKYGRIHTGASGVHALFSGSPGTGKTMAASIIANELGLELYRIDLATVVSKYIGETEKNLSRIFDEARNSNAIIFFDEADALFGKRSEVKDAHDRYANIEVSYLLQKIDEYDGLTILASNMVGNLDDAFRRRLHYIIEFPMPNESERETIWRLAITRETPTDSDLDYGFLASRLKLSAAGIKSVALRAALLAASKERAVSMRDIVEAVRREYQKEDRPFLEVDLAPYYASEFAN